MFPASGVSRTVDATLADYATNYLRRIVGVPSRLAMEPGPMLEVFRRADWVARWGSLETLSGDSADVLRRNLLAMQRAGNWRRLVAAPDPRVVLALIDRHPHCRGYLERVADEVALARRSVQSAFRLPPTLLVGEPGTGKTTLARDLARTVGLRQVFIAMASSSACFQLAGLALNWSTAGPGLIHTHITSGDGASANDLVVFDELDKVSGDLRWNPLGVLYTLLESSTARTFVDEAVQIPLDASRLNFIATANSLQLIEPALRSRFTVHVVPLPSPAEAAVIARHIYADLRGRDDWGASFAPELAPAVAEALSDHRPRTQTQLLRRAFARAAREGRGELRPDDVALRDDDDLTLDAGASHGAIGFLAELHGRTLPSPVRPVTDQPRPAPDPTPDLESRFTPQPIAA